jgi:uncharacterized protein YegP (UPF0339 family)
VIGTTFDAYWPRVLRSQLKPFIQPEPPMQLRLYIYKGKDGLRFRLRSRNGTKIGASTQGYSRMTDLRKNLWQAHGINIGKQHRKLRGTWLVRRLGFETRVEPLLLL